MKTQTKERLYFKGVTDPDQLKDLYRALARAYHPDRGGSTEQMQEINSQYDQAKKLLEAPAPSRKYAAPTRPQPKTSATSPSEAAMQAAVLAKFLCPGVWIEINGAEVIARGNTYEHKESLKEIGYWWSPELRAWHFVRRPAPTRKGVA